MDKELKKKESVPLIVEQIKKKETMKNYKTIKVNDDVKDKLDKPRASNKVLKTTDDVKKVVAKNTEKEETKNLKQTAKVALKALENLSPQKATR